MGILASYILRVGETEDDAAQTRNTNNGNLDRSYFYNYRDDYRVPLTQAGFDHGQTVRGKILRNVSELSAQLKLLNSEIMVVRSQSDRSLEMLNAVFGNSQLLPKAPFPPDDDLAAQDYGEYNGVSVPNRQNRLMYPESWSSFHKFGPWRGCAVGGESKEKVFNRNSDVVEKAEDAANLQGISIILYIADTGTIFYNLLARLTNRVPEDSLMLRKELALDYAALARVLSDTSRPMMPRNFRILWRGEPAMPLPEENGTPDLELQNLLDVPVGERRLDVNVN